MDRRAFLKNTSLVAPLIVAFNPFAAAQMSFIQKLALNRDGNPGRILVLIQLNGGNDGLNTVILLDKYALLATARQNILIPENKILKLRDTNQYGFHPSMPGLQQLYNDKLVSVIGGVGYPEPDFSHFRGINIKYTADPGKDECRSGWVGRYLEGLYPKFPTGYPLDRTDGPPAMRIGTVSPKIAQGTENDFSVGIKNITDFDNLGTVNEKDPVSNDPGGMNVAAIRSISKQIELYGPVIQSCVNKQKNKSKLYPEPEKNVLADQLKIVARLIGSGLNTPVYVVQQTGYDTHGDQVDKSDPTKGKHAELLAQLSEAIVAFQDDLTLMGKENDVMGMTFSEFGRRISSSDSYGTDHGTAETVFLFGTHVKSGITSASPELPAKITSNDNLPIEHDFRTLYASVLSGWFGTPEETIKTIIKQTPGDRLTLFKS